MSGNDSFFKETKAKDRSLLKGVEKTVRAPKATQRHSSLAESPTAVTDWRDLTIKGTC